MTFVKDELKRFKRVMQSDYSEPSASEEEHKSREVFLNITLDFLRRMKQDELANHLQTSKNTFI